MPRISLDVFRAPHQPSLSIGHQLTAVRLMTNVCLQSPQGWSRFHPAIIDTGAPISMFPQQIWRDVQFTAVGKLMAGGIVSREECRIPAILARVSCLLSDGRESIGPLSIHAYLAESDQVPTLLGIAGVLEENALWANIRGNSAFIEPA